MYCLADVDADSRVLLLNHSLEELGRFRSHISRLMLCKAPCPRGRQALYVALLEALSVLLNHRMVFIAHICS